MNHGAIAHRIVRPLGILSSPDQHTTRKDGLFPHIIRLEHLEPLIRQSTADRTTDCLDNSHNNSSCSILSLYSDEFLLEVPAKLHMHRIMRQKCIHTW